MARLTVALRMESVDRNSEWLSHKVYRTWSLSAWRAWIEIGGGGGGVPSSGVALRMESVDRNYTRIFGCS